MKIENGFEDIWTQYATDPEPQSEQSTQITAVQGVEPLGAQLGVVNPAFVPDALNGIAFDTLSSSVEQSSDGTPPTHTYAILDASKVPDLAEMLAASGLRHRCLFVGKAFEDLQDVAPYLVELEPNHSFTANLFTQSDAPWHLWGRNAGVILRGPARFKRLHAHLRRKMQILDSQNKAFFFRFWDPIHLLTFFKANVVTAKDQQWFLYDQNGLTLSHVLCNIDDAWLQMTAPIGLGAATHGMRLGDPLRIAFANAVKERARALDIAAVQKVFPDAPRDAIDTERTILLSLRFRRSEPIRAALCLCAFRHAQISGLPDTEREIISANRLSDLARIRLLKRAVGKWPQPEQSTP